ncbi:MarR family transcriptional regulator [Lentzea sp. NBRC 105346]|uniref:MarR family winged helix-turn-helix transcriptional regulator n=1 Tax=Lentzea sp. NBRC 105346 TaxID=3032205 RepID=UPI0024A57588|nr:MarR family transcriptional regulator [Lentzea sp. NBRC 105346]GLZ31916.1 MarR family transcriptional regulator [Lentzea sp. NBRC 105346]
MDALSAEVVALLGRITDRYIREYETAAARHGITPQQAKALLALEEPLPMRRVAERVGVEPSNITGIVDRLQTRGLVERQADPTDRRIKLIATTDAGKSAAADLRGHLRFASDPLVALTEPQRRALRDLLHLMAES